MNWLKPSSNTSRMVRTGRVLALYLAATWVLVQIATTVFPLLQLPDWTATLVLVLALIGLVPALILAWLYHPERGIADTAEPAAAPPAEIAIQAQPVSVAAAPKFEPSGRSVAVLPFVDMSPDRDQEYFSDGIAEEILNVLARADRLRVPARTSSFAFKGRNEDVREIGRTLGVATVLEGSVRKSGNRVRVTAQLINVADGFHLWSERFDRDMDDVFAIQDDIAHAIGEALDVRLYEGPRPATSHRQPTSDVRAYEYYLRGRQYFNQMRRTSMPIAQQMFEQAIEIDPDYALAHAGLADTCSFLYMYWDAREENLRCADEGSQRAVRLDPDAAETHVSRGFVLSLMRDWDAAAAEFKQAVAQGPNLFEAHYLHARSSWAAGRLEEAAGLFRRAHELRPEDYQSLALLGSVYQGLGRIEEAEKLGEKALKVIERHVDLNPDDARALCFGANMRLERGDVEGAKKWTDRAIALDPTDPVLHYNVACGFSMHGDLDLAFDHLNTAVSLGWRHPEWLENDGDLRAVRADPRYPALLARIS